MRAVLEHQNGNRGFGDTAQRILVVTCDYRAFASCTERNEAFVDGGMFAMSLVYALHALELGFCCLNLCQQNRTGRALRRVGNIPDHEALIMVIAVGHLPDALHVARSERRAVEDVLVFH
jgi:nitroreductase